MQKVHSPEAQASEGGRRLAAWFKPALPVLFGALLSLVTSVVVLELQNRSAAELQSQAIEENRELSVREQRRPVYLDYILAVNDWVVAQEARAQECVPGTDLPLAGADSCSVTYLGELQSHRYDLRALQAAMFAVESPEMRTLRYVFETMFPSTDPDPLGPIEGRPTIVYSTMYQLMVAFVACDSNPHPDGEMCDDIVANIEEIATTAGVDPREGLE